jgi:hypothetical protein
MGKNHQLNETILAQLIREADDRLFLDRSPINYQEHVTHTARHIAANYHNHLQKALRKAAKDAAVPVKSHRQKALKPVAGSQVKPKKR